jgi:hypothetical protein
MNNRIDLSNVHVTSPIEFLRDYGCVPIINEIPYKTIEEVYKLFDKCAIKFDALCCLLKEWEIEFAKTEESKPLGAVRFGMRDKRPVSTIKDKKYYLQFGREYFDWVTTERLYQLKANPELHELFMKLREIDDITQKIFIKQIDTLLGAYKEQRKHLFYNYQSQPRIPVSIRLICYINSGEFNTRPHYDKAAFGLLFPSDDNPQAECLLVSPANGENFDLNNLRQVVRTPVDTSVQSCALLISGTLLEHLGIPIPPTAHLVLPHDGIIRHVLVAFCNVPYLDSEIFKRDYNIMQKTHISPEFIKKFK